MKNGKHIGIDGAEYWYKDDKIHREDGPAIIWPNGLQIWFKNGKIHREDGPAITYPNGSERWWVLDTCVDPFTPEEYPLILVSVLNL